jgi:hypothetical protein
VWLSDNATNAIGVALTDGPTNRKTTRSSADRTLQFTIAHQESNENTGFRTQRSNVRVTFSKEDVATGKSVDAYAQLTMSIPYDVVTVPETETIVAQLINFLLAPDRGGSDANSVLAADVNAPARLLAGEP